MSLALTEKQTREIEAFCQIARENGAAISLRELIRLAAIDASERELEGAFQSDSHLRSKFLLESGFVLERSLVPQGEARQDVEQEMQKRERARTNLGKASRFGKMFVNGTVLVSVSGANSYLSAREDEDIDFFCVTRTNGMWAFMLKTLILARIHRLANRDVPELCFSCVMDERWANQAFSGRQPPIFARDALTARVIGGNGAYHGLIRKASWMEGYFPVFYGMRLRETTPGPADESQTEASRKEGSVVLNSLLYHVLGSFLRLKSWALNRKLAKAARRSSIFKTKIGEGHYIYESVRYRNLGAIYEELVEETAGRGRTGPEALTDQKENDGQEKDEGMVKVITTGRKSSLPHIAKIRFVLSDGAYLVMGAGLKSDWFLNALTSKSARVRDGRSLLAVTCEEFLDERKVRQLFAEKYGTDVLDAWYSGPEIRSLKLTPIGFPSQAKKGPQA